VQSRYYQYVYRGLGVDVSNRYDFVILIQNVAWYLTLYDPAKDAVLSHYGPRIANRDQALKVS
jgi:hypothetical protein